MRLTVGEEDGKLTGAILFYMILRSPGGEQTASPGYPEPMIEPRFDGNALEFKVSHRYAHPPRTLNDPPVTFRLELAGPDRMKAQGPEPGQPAVELDRRKYQ